MQLQREETQDGFPISQNSSSHNERLANKKEQLISTSMLRKTRQTAAAATARGSSRWWWWRWDSNSSLRAATVFAVQDKITVSVITFFFYIRSAAPTEFEYTCIYTHIHIYTHTHEESCVAVLLSCGPATINCWQLQSAAGSCDQFLSNAEA